MDTGCIRSFFGRIIGFAGNNLPAIFFSSGASFLLTGIFLLMSSYSDSNKPVILSPLGSGARSGDQDIYYSRIMKGTTLDNFPPNRYFPSSPSAKFRDDFPDIQAGAFAAMDRDSGELLVARRLTQRMAIASITKVMTAIVTLENIPADKILTVPPYASKIGEASMGLSSGEKLTVEDLLYGAMLPSGNDAAETLAEGAGKHMKGINQGEVDGGNARKFFITRMNEKAQTLGMMDTYFFNPTGLDGDDRGSTSFSTALDLLALGNYAMENKVLGQIAATRYKIIPYKDGYHKAFFLENILGLSQTFKGIIGIKPGNSVYAGETLLSYAEHSGRRIIVAILGSNRTKDDVLKIYKKVFNGNISVE